MGGRASGAAFCARAAQVPVPPERGGETASGHASSPAPCCSLSEHRRSLSDGTLPAACHASLLTRQLRSQPAPWTAFRAQHLPPLRQAPTARAQGLHRVSTSVLKTG